MAAGEDPRLQAFQDNGELNFTLSRLLTAADLDLLCDFGGKAGGATTIAHALAALVAYRTSWISAVSPSVAASIPKVSEQDPESGGPLLLHSPEAFQTALRIADGAAIAVVRELRASKPRFNPVMRTGPTELWMRTTIRDHQVREAILRALAQAGRDSKELRAIRR